MATKLAKNGTYYEYVVIRPTYGIGIDTIANAILCYHQDIFNNQTGMIEKHNLKQFFHKNNTWNKVMSQVKETLLVEGLERLDYIFESIEYYDQQLEKVKGYIQKINPQIGTKK